jgi:valyl-tRNA synthetase
VIADESVDPKFGTGAVKITPAHDSNDFATGTRHKLEFINVLHPDGRINERGGEYAGMERCEAREAIVEDLRGQNLLEKIEPHPLSAGHCYRCHTIIEPYLSKQWFVSMKPLAQPAIEAVRKGKIVFYPKRWTKVYLNWMENIQDWCISRQIWWGHRIPVYYCATCLKMTEDGGRKTDARRHARQGVMVSRVRPQKCPACGATDIRQDEDVLDTWFSSWLWPFATFGWPFAETGDQTEDARRRTEEDALRYFYPTAALVTAPEIIFFWVARMIMAGFEFQKKEPFRHVYIHGTVRDIEGKKMSKSLGNIIDPLEIIADYGADALRFSLISITAQGQDVFLSRERFEQGRNFANKIWNASRFIMMNMNGVTVAESDSHPVHLDMVNRWIVSRFHSTLRETGKNLQAYKFNEAANLLYSFFWHEFCDWYLELIKADIRNPATQEVMRAVLEDFLKCLHPFMPFVTEDIVYRLRALSARPHASIMTEAWPQADERRIDRKLEKRMEALFAVVTHLRNMRAALMLKPDQKIRVSAYPHTRQSRTQLEACLNLVQDLVKAESIALLDTDSRPRGVLSALAPEIDLYVHLEGVIDIDKETLKIKTEIQKKKESRKAKEERLQNAAFRQKAPADVVAKEEESVRLLGAEVTRLEQMLQDLS